MQNATITPRVLDRKFGMLYMLYKQARYDLIPYQYAIDTSKDEHILELAKESKEMKDTYR